MGLTTQIYIAGLAAILFYVGLRQLATVSAMRWWTYSSVCGFAALLLKYVAGTTSGFTAGLAIGIGLLCGGAQLYLAARGMADLSGVRRAWTHISLAVGFTVLAGFFVMSVVGTSGWSINVGAALDVLAPIVCGMLAVYVWGAKAIVGGEKSVAFGVLTLAFAAGILEHGFELSRYYGFPFGVLISQSVAVLGMTFMGLSDARHRARALRTHSDRLQGLFSASPCGVCELDATGHINLANPAALKLLGLPNPVPASVAIDTRLEPVDEPSARAFSDFVLRPSAGLSAAKFAIRDAGLPTRAECSIVPVSGDSESGRCLVATLRDITNHEATARLLHMRAELLEMIARNKSVEEVLKALVQALEQHMPGWYCSVLVCEGDSFAVAATGNVPEAFRAALNQAPFQRLVHTNARSGQGHDWEKSLRTVARSHGFAGICLEPLVSGANELIGALLLNRVQAASLSAEETQVVADIARIAGLAIEHRRSLERLQHQGYHDALTGLPNRLLFADRLKHSLARSERRGKRLALLCIDLDRFKYVNDTLGHEVGDIFLQQISVRLAARIRSSDTLARTGGDEFMAIIDDVPDRAGAEGVANSLRAALQDAFEIDGHTLYGTASIGIAVYPQDGTDAESLQRNADRAMYRAKALGKNTVQSFSSHDSTQTSDRIDIEAHLHRALEDGGFALHFQPQFTCEGRRLAGFEALLRLRHPKLGLVQPSQFIPIAEESGLIIPIGDWVLHEACRQIAEWRRKGMRPIRVAVNVSPLQFARTDFSKTVARALDAAGITPDLLELEITEGVLMTTVGGSARQIAAIAENGVRLSVDDFGTGYSSLSYLYQLPIQILKIDRSFVDKIAEPAGTRSIVEAIISLAHALRLQTVAEGVENEDQLAILNQAGCDLIQGFLLSRPLPAVEASRLLWQETMAPNAAASGHAQIRAVGGRMDSRGRTSAIQ